jgi:hypothetical protein
VVAHYAQAGSQAPADVVDFVLHDAGRPPREHSVDGLAVFVERFDPDDGQHAWTAHDLLTTASSRIPVCDARWVFFKQLMVPARSADPSERMTGTG